MFAGSSEFSNFLEVLKARCEVWDMEGGKDWRRKEAEETAPDENMEKRREEIIEGFTGLEKMASGNLELEDEQKIILKDHPDENNAEGHPQIMKGVTPKKYLLSGVDSEKSWEAIVESSQPPESSLPIAWAPTTLLIYGRIVPVPRQQNGVTFWTFDELCGGTFGPADYITLASTFHTIILDDVPVLTILQKNEARRLITLLDALYEARCKLIIRAEAGPDELFFPEILQSASSASTPNSESRSENEGGDAVYPETFSEIYQDQTSPFRPNISSYTDKVDEDSDFNPGISDKPGSGNEIGRQVDFGMTSSFTGEDERFAYKRARSRLWEMCGTKWHARREDGWWRPLPVEVRRWERSVMGPSVPYDPMAGIKNGIAGKDEIGGDVRLGPSVELDRPAGLQGKELEEKEKGV
jgi:protein AFG1